MTKAEMSGTVEKGRLSAPGVLTAAAAIAVVVALQVVYAVTADRTGRSFATAGRDGHLQVLDVDPGRVLTRICAGVGMPMSGDEWRRFEPDVDRPVICD